MVSRGWGVRFQQRLVPLNGDDLRAIRVSQPWVKECEAQQDAVGNLQGQH